MLAASRPLPSPLLSPLPSPFPSQSHSLAPSTSLTTDQHYTQSWSQPQSQAEKERERDKSGAGSKWKSFDCAHGHGMHSSPNAVRAKGAREATSPLLPASLRRLVSNPPPWLPRVWEKILRWLPERSGRVGSNHPCVSRALGAPGKQPLPLASRAL